MRILVCNDDGFDAPGIHLLAKTARAMAPDVWVVAPERKWTAASHQLSFDCDLTLTRTADRTYTCSGAPADCVVAAMTVLFAEGEKPDLVLAGVNDKRNVAEDIAYSGTMAIAREATFWGTPAIAVSRAVPGTDAPEGLDALRRLLQALWNGRSDWAADGHWLSINLPAALPAPIVQAHVGRDRIGGASDVLENAPERIVYRIGAGARAQAFPATKTRRSPREGSAWCGTLVRRCPGAGRSRHRLERRRRVTSCAGLRPLHVEVDSRGASLGGGSGPTACCHCAARSVLASSVAIVIGPTPPGTGVIQRDFLAASKSTSPQSMPSACD